MDEYKPRPCVSGDEANDLQLETLESMGWGSIWGSIWIWRMIVIHANISPFHELDGMAMTWPVVTMETGKENILSVYSSRKAVFVKVQMDAFQD